MWVVREGHEVSEKADGKCFMKYSSFSVDSTIDTIKAFVDDAEKLQHKVALYEDLAAYPSTFLQNQICLQQLQSSLRSLQQSVGRHQAPGAAVQRAEHVSLAPEEALMYNMKDG